MCLCRRASNIWRSVRGVSQDKKANLASGMWRTTDGRRRCLSRFRTQMLTIHRNLWRVLSVREKSAWLWPSLVSLIGKSFSGIGSVRSWLRRPASAAREIFSETFATFRFHTTRLIRVPQLCLWLVRATLSFTWSRGRKRIMTTFLLKTTLRLTI